jgi:primosomal protein N' (replication factor Y)
MPDFRARERTFQLVAQVAGRTGRGRRGGQVIVQTSVPDEPSIEFAARHDYLGFAELELAERREHGFPPFSRACRIVCHGKKEEAVESRTAAVADAACAAATALGDGTEVHGPSPAPVTKLRMSFRYHLMVISPHPSGMRRVLRSLDPLLGSGGGVVTTVDVDALNML